MSAIKYSRKDQLPEEVKPHIHIQAKSLGSFIEYYKNTPASAFKLPSHTHHWLILQERQNPQRFLVQVGDREQDLSADLSKGELIYVPPFMQTHWDFSLVDACLHLLIPDKLLLDIITTNTAQNKNCLLARFTPVIGKQDRRICLYAQSFMKRIQTEPNLPKLELDDFIINLAEMLIRYQANLISDNQNENISKVAGLGAQTCALIDDYIEEYLDTDMGVDELAGLASLSTYYFSRCFKSVYGMSPYQYVSQVRLAKMRRILCKNETCLVDMALQCGFSDQAHMTRTFKRLSGVTPHAYRKLMSQ